MTFFICTKCGMQYADSTGPPKKCLLCNDPRSFLNWKGQQWTTLEELASKGYQNVISEAEADLYKIRTKPSVAISQRAFLVRTTEGNLLWDCVSYIDESTIDAIRKLGWVIAIAISHPHYYSTMVEWSEAFDDAPIYINNLDRKWIMRKSSNIALWKGGKKKLFAGLELVHLGGHFDGGTVLHWPQGANSRGVVLSGDIIKSAEDRRWAAFMYSYPNMIPLSGKIVRRMADTICTYKFERMYSSFEDLEIISKARAAVRRSADRYIRFLRVS